MSLQMCWFTTLRLKIFFPIGISILVRAFFVEFVQSADWEYETCRPRNCTSGPNIGYPFYIEDDKNDTSFCGYPGFNVACENDIPVYATSRGNYTIEDIFYEERSFRLVNAEVTYNSSCLSPDRIFDFDRSSFVFGPNFVDLYLFYHCNDSFPENYTQNLIACASNATHRSYAVLNVGKKEINFSAMPCESVVAAPVEVEGGQDNQTVESIDYTKLLENGFTLEWSAAISCTDCEKTGGYCGYNHSEVVCFCRDGEHSKRCYNDLSNKLEEVEGSEESRIKSLCCRSTGLVCSPIN